MVPAGIGNGCTDAGPRVSARARRARGSADSRARSPLQLASDAETDRLVNLAYSTYLNIYMQQYTDRSTKERRALSLVELKGATYKETAAELGVRVELLKMLIFRARRKIYRGVNREVESMIRDAAS